MTAIRNTRTTERMSQGVIAAVNNNGRGVCGIAGGRSNSGGVRIMSCQIMGNSTTGGKGNPTVKAFEYAWTNGAIIAQNSWGYNLETADGTKITPEEFEREWKSNYGIMRDAIDTFVRGAGTRNPNSPLQGGLVIFAAGNEGDVYGDVPDLSGRLRSGDRRRGDGLEFPPGLLYRLRTVGRHRGPGRRPLFRKDDADRFRREDGLL